MSALDVVVMIRVGIDTADAMFVRAFGERYGMSPFSQPMDPRVTELHDAIQAAKGAGLIRLVDGEREDGARSWWVCAATRPILWSPAVGAVYEVTRYLLGRVDHVHWATVVRVTPTRVVFASTWFDRRDPERVVKPGSPSTRSVARRLAVRCDGVPAPGGAGDEGCV